jgi:hypothetical protein
VTAVVQHLFAALNELETIVRFHQLDIVTICRARRFPEGASAFRDAS